MPVEAAMLHNVPLFELLDDEELKELSAHIDEDTFAAGQTVFEAGDPGAEMHVVLRGKIHVFITDDDGKNVTIAELGEGEFVGELSLLDSEPRSATAVAQEPTRTFVIDRDDLLRLFRLKPEAALDIIATLGSRIRATDILLAHRVARNPNQIIEEKLTFGQRVADRVASFGGSWNFIGLFALALVAWVILNTIILTSHPFDPFPFILLNLFLSMLAALQAPVIMMSQNRQDAKDRVRSEQDYKVNLKAELEIEELHRKLDELRADLRERDSTQAK
jgi:CRP/FNR family cyclic AMP-dependent transcriptional regulator